MRFSITVPDKYTGRITIKFFKSWEPAVQWGRRQSLDGSGLIEILETGRKFFTIDLSNPKLDHQASAAEC